MGCRVIVKRFQKPIDPTTNLPIKDEMMKEEVTEADEIYESIKLDDVDVT